jgi:hypothetical protein
LIVAKDGFELVHTPTEDINGIVVVAPAHTLFAPPIVPALGIGLTVIILVA